MNSKESENLISRCSQTQAQSDFRILFASLYGSEVFFNIDRNPHGKIHLTTYKIGPLEHVVKLFTSKTHSQLQQPFAGIQWAPALAMVLDMPEADGLSVVNDAEDWVVFSSHAVRSNLKDQGNRREEY